MSFLYIRVYHGPPVTFGAVGLHKPQFLSGLRDSLRKLGYRVDLVPVEHINYCMIEMCGHEIFRCNIQQLHFNTTSGRDVVASRAIDAVMQSSVKFRRARAYLWFWTWLEFELFKRGKHCMSDYWVKNIKSKYTPLEGTEECIKCCKFLLTKQDTK
ncbi:uncharacterized protein LOC113495234 [Trichoplusia ni]|uniref:Uncharacterized protein LOC113495234 n=1 Tax=Trichoplusia ni TaxID=7111 RepID=A0A7E5VMV3_TRINI|nr:uncharacterized protein LOC113495234 [Trichoplusia ni]